MVVVVASGGGAVGALGLVGHAASIQTAVATAASELALAAAGAAEVAGAAALSEAALTAAVAAESAATAALGVTAANIWNPAGWIIGGVLVGASPQTPWAVTWGCYKPIIGEADTQETSIEPIKFADLVAHPKVRRVLISASIVSANLPKVEIENEVGQRYLLQGVALPWGSVAYHAERIDE